MIVGGEVGQDRRVRELLHRTDFFYVDGGLVESTDPVWLQGAYDTLTGFFNRVGIWKNPRKTVRMLCCPFYTVGNQSEAAYKRRMKGEGTTYRA